MTIRMAEFPAFVFERHYHVDKEAGFIPAGLLIIDRPKRTEANDEERHALSKIVERLIELLESDNLAENALIMGWHGKRKPPNAVDTSDQRLIARAGGKIDWIVLRIDPDYLWIDSDALRHLGIIEGH